MCTVHNWLQYTHSDCDIGCTHYISVGTNVYILIIYVHFTIENDESSTTCEAQEIWPASTTGLKAHQEHFG